MFRKVTCLVAMVAVVLSVPLSAQDQRFEGSLLLGWTFSDGVEGDPVVTGDFEVFDRIDPKDSFKWGLMAGFNVTESVEVGFLYGNQATTLEVSGTSKRDVGDISVKTYHPYVGYNFLDSASKVRPYFYFGLGATSFGSVDFTRLNGQPGTVPGETQFSTTWGVGAKFFATPNFGARLGLHWTPTYIKSDAEGYWCDPWWGCYLVGDSQYSNQWDLAGGVIFRF